MSGGVLCRCAVRDRSRWVVRDDHCNHSAFNGYRWTSSDWSAVECLECGSIWRTKAKYVDELRRAL